MPAHQAIKARILSDTLVHDGRRQRSRTGGMATRRQPAGEMIQRGSPDLPASSPARRGNGDGRQVPQGLSREREVILNGARWRTEVRVRAVTLCCSRRHRRPGPAYRSAVSEDEADRYGVDGEGVDCHQSE
jgi:hypothetical protein